jgi:predicted permease
MGWRDLFPKRRRADEDPADELRAHLDHRMDDLVREGLSPDEARRRARLEFGSVERYREEAREAGRAGNSLARLPDQLWRELYQAARRLAAAPSFALFSIVTLAIGIGVTAAVYSVIYSGMWRPLQVHDPDRIVVVGRESTFVPRGQISWPDFIGIERQQTTLTLVAAWGGAGGSFYANGRAELVHGEVVSGRYFDLVGVRPALGRLIQSGDDRAGAPDIVVLSDHTWRLHLGADPQVIGKTVKLARRSFQVVGVAPEGFRGLETRGLQGVAFWAPLSSARLLVGDISQERDPIRMPRGWLMVGGRLRPGDAPTAAASELARIGDRQDAIAPLWMTINGAPGEPPSRHPAPRKWTTVPVVDDEVLSDNREIGRIIVALPALVLLVACTNLANLVLSRGTSRRHEFAVRRALGATRARLIREQFADSALLGIAGGIAGLLIARALLVYFVGMTRESLATFVPGGAVFWQLESGVLAGTFAAVALSMIVAGLIPAWQLTRDGDRSALTGDPASAAVPRWRGRSNLIALQVGVSVCLFLIAVVFVQMVVRLPGARFVADAGIGRVAVATVPFEMPTKDDMRIRAVVDLVLARLKDDQEIDAAAAASMLPYRGARLFTGRSPAVTPPDQPFDARPESGHETDLTAMTPEYWRATGLPPLVSGRGFDERDQAAAAPAAIVNEGLALDVWGTTEVIGRELLMRDTRAVRAGAPTAPVTRLTVVGVVAGRERAQHEAGHEHSMFVPLAQDFPPYTIGFLARARAGGEAPVAKLAEAIRAVDPELAMDRLVSAEVLELGPLAFMRWLAAIVAGLAVLALALAMAGLYGVLSHVVDRRMREMGVRMALGADAGRLARLVRKDGFRPVVEGLFIGLATAVVVRVFLKFQFVIHEVAPIDPLAFGAAAALLGAAALVACYLPARRAARVDPNIALRAL